MKEQQRDFKTAGITLTALAVTILVLFILAGISITAALGDKGIINETKDAQKDIADLQNQTLDDLQQLTNELATSAGDALKPATPVPVENIKSNWEVINKIAKAIAEGSGTDENEKAISSSSTQATVIVEGKSYTIKVGNEFEVTYNSVARRVRVLGFKHDDLTSPTTAYGNKTTATKAGISFEFLDSLMDNTPMHSSDYYTNGWVTKELYATLNNTTNGTYKELQNEGIPIKQVQKIYNATYSKSDPQTSSDYLWLLSCTEIWGDSAYTSSVSAYSKAKEGEQYAFYSNCTPKPVYNVENDNVKHYNSAGTSVVECWLRSLSGNPSLDFCSVGADGICSGFYASVSSGVAPGFSI